MKVCDPSKLAGRPADYVAEVTAAGHRMPLGQWLHLLRRHKMHQHEATEWSGAPASALPVGVKFPSKAGPGLPPKDEAKAEATCRGCDLFQPETDRCMRPKCGCPASSFRVKPWAKMAHCPGGLW